MAGDAQSRASAGREGIAVLPKVKKAGLRGPSRVRSYNTRNQRIAYPPSTGRVVPVTKSEARDA